MQKGNLVILVICQLISATGSIVMVTLGGIIGSTLTGNQALATLPVSMMVVAVAITAVPATMLMHRSGRSRGFAMASLSAAAALLIASLALAQASFGLFIVAGMLFGIAWGYRGQKWTGKWQQWRERAQRAGWEAKREDLLHLEQVFERRTSFTEMIDPDRGIN